MRARLKGRIRNSRKEPRPKLVQGRTILIVKGSTLSDSIALNFGEESGKQANSQPTTERSQEQRVSSFEQTRSVLNRQLSWKLVKPLPLFVKIRDEHATNEILVSNLPKSDPRRSRNSLRSGLLGRMEPYLHYLSSELFHYFRMAGAFLTHSDAYTVRRPRSKWSPVR